MSFSVVDKRGSRPLTTEAAKTPRLITQNTDAQIRRMREAGQTMPKSSTGARMEMANIRRSVENRTLISSMRQQRTASNIQLALPKVREPLSSLKDKKIPFDTTSPKELKEIRRWCRLFYTTHDLVPLLIDIYAKFPVVGLEFDCKDPSIKKFYEDMFFNTLDYENFLQDLGREYFTSGEANSLAHFDETLGIWSSEEILNPDNLAVSRSMFQGKERVQLLVKDMVDALRNGVSGMDADLTESEKLERNYEYKMLTEQYPEMIEAAARNDGLDISDMLISRIVNKAQPWDLRGTPHLLRSFRTLMMEESLNAAQDAVADRLYSPFILATLGIPDLGDGTPWIPDQADLDMTRDDMQTALAADFRLMVHNFGLNVQSVFGRESVPRFDQDYSRIDKKLMQAWGIGEALISGGTGTQNYASTALNREFVTQMMNTYQKMVRRHMLKRCEVIAEAQEHFDYEDGGGRRRPVYREIVDPSTGEVRRVPKLLLPEIKFSTLNLRDEAQERAFLQQLKAQGVPISDTALAVNIPIDFKQELERTTEEKVEKLLAEAQAMKRAAELIEEHGLPIPPELAKYLAADKQLKRIDDENRDAEARADINEERADILQETGTLPSGMGSAGTSNPNNLENGINKSLQDGGAKDPGSAPADAPDSGGGSNPGSAAPRNKSRPDESDEQRGTEPKAASWKFASAPSSVGHSTRIDESRIEAAIERNADPYPSVRKLVESRWFYADLNQYDLDYSADFDQIEAYHSYVEAGRPKRSKNERPFSDRIVQSYKDLTDMLDHYEMTYGVTPVWN